MILRMAYLISKHISTCSEARTIMDPVTTNIALLIRASDQAAANRVDNNAGSSCAEKGNKFFFPKKQAKTKMESTDRSSPPAENWKNRRGEHTNSCGGNQNTKTWRGANKLRFCLLRCWARSCWAVPSEHQEKQGWSVSRVNRMCLELMDRWRCSFR